MFASAAPAVVSNNATARARDANAVEGDRMRHGRALARARVPIGTSAGNFNRAVHASNPSRSFVETPIAGLGNCSRSPWTGAGQRKVMEDRDAITTSNTRTGGRRRSGDDGRDDVP